VLTLRNAGLAWQVGLLAAVLAAGLPLAASPLNVTNQTTASLNTDDALFFTLATYGFAADASALGLPTLPSGVSFSFVTSSPAPGGPWDALLETPAGSVIATFPEFIEFEPAEYQSADYSGPVGDLAASITLSPAQSQALFGNASIVLVLQNIGSAVTIGLPPYTIAHDLDATLSGDGLSTGAVVDGVTLADPPGPGVPEPGAGWLFAGGAALCWAARYLAAKKRARPCSLDRANPAASLAYFPR
jgi:hypothetical protein